MRRCCHVEPLATGSHRYKREPHLKSTCATREPFACCPSSIMIDANIGHFPTTYIFQEAVAHKVTRGWWGGGVGGGGEFLGLELFEGLRFWRKSLHIIYKRNRRQRHVCMRVCKYSDPADTIVRLNFLLCMSIILYAFYALWVNMNFSQINWRDGCRFLLGSQTITWDKNRQFVPEAADLHFIINPDLGVPAGI